MYTLDSIYLFIFFKILFDKNFRILYDEIILLKSVENLII